MVPEFRRPTPHILIRAAGEWPRPYDLNPVPTDIKPRVLTTAVDLDDGSASLGLAMNVVGYFELNEDKAQVIAVEVGQQVATWREMVARLGLIQAEIDRMASAFGHEDLLLQLRSNNDQEQHFFNMVFFMVLSLASTVKSLKINCKNG